MGATWLPVFWASLIAFAMLFYVILDGYDLGIGILSGTTRDEDFKDTMMSAIAPFWNGNEVWLVLIGAGLFAVFPMVYAIFLPAFYLPMALMLIGLIFRGISFEFRYHAGRCRRFWDWGFCFGSFMVSLVQGIAMGKMVQGISVVNGQYAGGAFDWLTPFSLFCGVGLVIGYTLLGAAWLVFKTQGDIRDWAYDQLGWLLAGVLLVLVVVFAYTLAIHPRVRDRFFEDMWLMIFPLIIALSSISLWTGVKRRLDWVPYGMAVVIFFAAFLALEASFWPYLIPFTVTIETAAAPIESLRFLFYGAGIVLFPVILFYTGIVYWIMRGKV
jgi:cytochrome d ubiquinol oxidase subunit II